ncbi:MAG: PepSY-like domain-containing protein [Bacteroidaceae bacterium]|nr:PepSY-like domain-containing protein [Bacteroidaceae bacterium]
MKRILYFLFALLAVTQATACNDKDEKEQKDQMQLPPAAQKFVKAHFPSLTIKRVKKDNDNDGSLYEVTLSDNTTVDFDKNGDWTEVDCGRKAVPPTIVPGPISKYVKTAYPKQKIVQIDKQRKGYEIELSNDVDITFNAAYKVVRTEK